eukprot:CAMPEP_0194327326 /NCGR_PEP_ID=MMETSP0171-20130528/40581_1 /TAXON_ID=218684 /ORGANISM="Corethron pennatum, Strain L29A3" /LENGTH=141 /DNA_ID=CAMNT_0039087243 /DNA_START=171 /DNA_END=597 /DNA_ORIENTATION=-
MAPAIFSLDFESKFLPSLRGLFFQRRYPLLVPGGDDPLGGLLLGGSHLGPVVDHFRRPVLIDDDRPHGLQAQGLPHSQHGDVGSCPVLGPRSGTSPSAGSFAASSSEGGARPPKPIACPAPAPSDDADAIVRNDEEVRNAG